MKVWAPWEEPVPSPGVLSHWCGVPGTHGASTPNHQGMQHVNIPRWSCCQRLFKDPPPISGTPRLKRAPEHTELGLCKVHLIPEGKTSLPLPWESSGGTVKRQISRTVIPKSRQHQNKQESQPALLIPGLTLQPCSTAGNIFLGTIPSCFPPATAGNQGTSVRRISLGGQTERPSSQMLLLGFAGRGGWIL